MISDNYSLSEDKRSIGGEELNKIVKEDPKEERLKYMVFALFGFLSLYPLFVGFSEAGIFEAMYPGMKYTFFVVMPSYVCVIPVLIITKIMANVKIHTQMYIGIAGVAIGLTGVAFTPFIFGTSVFCKF